MRSNIFLIIIKVYEIARVKQRDEHLSHIQLEQLCRTIMGQASSMGIDVTFEKETTEEPKPVVLQEQTQVKSTIAKKKNK